MAHKTLQLNTKQLDDVTRRTIRHYNDNAQRFHDGTHDHDVSQNINALLRHIHHNKALDILDLGCGPGRDLLHFKSLGHNPVGLDGAQHFCEMAQVMSECPVLHQNLLSLELPESNFDGIFANAVLFHVPCQELPKVLSVLFNSLKPEGVFFSSNPRGHNEEGWQGDRYGSYHELSQWQHYLTQAGFFELEHYYRPEGLPRPQQPWLASVWRKPAKVNT